MKPTTHSKCEFHIRGHLEAAVSCGVLAVVAVVGGDEQWRWYGVHGGRRGRWTALCLGHTTEIKLFFQQNWHACPPLPPHTSPQLERIGGSVAECTLNHESGPHLNRPSLPSEPATTPRPPHHTCPRAPALAQTRGMLSHHSHTVGTVQSVHGRDRVRRLTARRP